MRVILTAAALATTAALAACAVPAERTAYSNTTTYETPGRVYSERTYYEPPPPLWARPGYNHSNQDHYAP